MINLSAQRKQRKGLVGKWWWYVTWQMTEVTRGTNQENRSWFKGLVMEWWMEYDIMKTKRYYDHICYWLLNFQFQTPYWFHFGNIFRFLNVSSANRGKQRNCSPCNTRHTTWCSFFKKIKLFINFVKLQIISPRWELKWYYNHLHVGGISVT